MHQPSQDTLCSTRTADEGSVDAAPSPAGRRDRRTRRSARLDSLAVALVAAMTVLLWAAAVHQTRDTLSRFGAEQAVGAQVTDCPDDRIIAPPCEVTFDQDGEVVTRELTHPGWFGVEPGDDVEVFATRDGTVALAGWRSLADSALLFLLALAFTSYTMRRWVRAHPRRRAGRSASTQGEAGAERRPAAFRRHHGGVQGVSRRPGLGASDRPPR